MSIDLKAAKKELREIKARADALEKLIENAKREPRELPYDIDTLIEGIQDGSLCSEVMVGDYLKFKLSTGEEVKLIVIGENHDITTTGKPTKCLWYGDVVPDELHEHQRNRLGRLLDAYKISSSHFHPSS